VNFLVVGGVGWEGVCACGAVSVVVGGLLPVGGCRGVGLCGGGRRGGGREEGLLCCGGGFGEGW